MNYFFCALIVLLPQQLDEFTKNQFVIWNVGQGSTSTLISQQSCIHIDFGGEDFPREILHRCRDRKNYIFLTHFDRDHINFIARKAQELKKICLATALPSALNKTNLKIFKGLSSCKTFPHHRFIQTLSKSSFQKKNQSHNYMIAESILITGDNTKKEELQLLNISALKSQVQILLAGHHGSRTSTGTPLLKHLKNLKLIVASSRKKRYGHPHKETMERAKKMAVPLLTTESYGHIFIDLEDSKLN